MPLSEDEQRILRQIEEQLQRDPGFGRNLHRTPDGSRRRLFLWAAATVGALALTIVFLSVSPFLSFAAFLVAVASALFLERQARLVGEAGLNHLSESMRGRFNAQQRPGGSDDHR
jgi:hypothetical protein